MNTELNNYEKAYIESCKDQSNIKSKTMFINLQTINHLLTEVIKRVPVVHYRYR